MIIHSEYLTGTTASGVLSLNTQSSLMGLAREIIVSPATASTIYNINITNENSLDVFNSSSITGNFEEEVALPLRGVYTIDISEATRDELFKIELVLEE